MGNRDGEEGNMKEAWAAMTLLQKVGALLLGWFALALLTLSAWWLLVGQHKDENDEEYREAVRRKVRDDDRKGGPS